MLTENEQKRYDRQIIMYGFGEEGQEKLKRSTVFIAGAGGLGSPIATYLAAAGIGRLRIVDRDSVELSNLNRQILHHEENIGQLKVASAASKLTRLNSDITIEPIHESIEADNAADLIADADCIIDAMDNLPTRYLLNRTAIVKNIPFIHGAVNGYEGRVMTVIPGESACLNCLYHGIETPKEIFPILGATAGVIGCLQAVETVKYLVGSGDLLLGRLLCYDGYAMKFSELKVKRDSNCTDCGSTGNR